MQRYSIASLVGQALRGNAAWKPAWRESPLKKSYDVVIIGGGGHGLATAYYLAKKSRHHECRCYRKGMAGQWQHCRNTTVVRSE